MPRLHQQSIAWALSAVITASITVAIGALATPARAAAIHQPVSITSPQGSQTQVSPTCYALSHIRDQSGLSAPYVSGATPFNSYVASTTHGLTGPPSCAAGFTNTLGQPVQQFTLDMGAALWVDALAFWGATDNLGSVSQFKFFADQDSLFGNGNETLLGNFTASPQLVSMPGQVFGFAPVNARHFHVSTNLSIGFPGIGELALRDALAPNPAPEPGSLALTGAGLLALAALRRRAWARPRLPRLPRPPCRPGRPGQQGRRGWQRWALAALLTGPALAAQATPYTVNWLSLAPTAVGGAVPANGTYASGVNGIGPVGVSHTAGAGFVTARQQSPLLQNQSVIDPNAPQDSHAWSTLDLLAVSYVTAQASPVSSGLNQSWAVTYNFQSPLAAGSQLVLGVMGLGRRVPDPHETVLETTTVALVGALLGSYAEVGEYIGPNNWGATHSVAVAGGLEMVNSVVGAGGGDPWWNTGLALLHFNNSMAMNALTVRFNQTLGDGVGVNIGFIDAAQTQPVPEPGSLALALGALLAAGWVRGRRSRPAVRGALAAGALALLGSTASANVSPPPSSWELAAEFNPWQQYNGQTWNVGWKGANCAAVNGFCPMTGHLPLSEAPLLGWVEPGLPGGIPLAAQNYQASAIITSSGLVVQPRGLLLHPGMNGEVVTIRFRPPTAGLYRINGLFYAQDATANTHVVTRITRASSLSPATAPVFVGAVKVSYPQTAPVPQNLARFQALQVMLNGSTDRLDFEVAAGPGNNYLYGMTGLHGLIERIGPYCNPSLPSCGSP